MGCCGKKVKDLAGKAKSIAVGYTNLARGVKYEFTDDRIRACQRCSRNKWRGKTLWCQECGCYVPAKARVKEEKCPLGLWKS